MGSRIAARARPAKLERGVLVIRTASAAWAQELALLADDIVGPAAHPRSSGTIPPFPRGPGRPTRATTFPRHASRESSRCTPAAAAGGGAAARASTAASRCDRGGGREDPWMAADASASAE